MAANKSVEKTLKILELISRYPDGITLSEIYKDLKMPKASVYDILQALYKEDAIYFKDQHQKTYVIGSKIYAIGQAYTKNSNFINYVSTGLKNFANKYGLTAFACKRLGDKQIYIYKYEALNTRITTNDIGVQMPLYLNPSGKAFLAFVSKMRQDDLLSQILEKDFNGERTIEYENLVKELEIIKNQGYAIDNGVTENYVCSYAVPVFNFENKVTGVISASNIISNNNEDLENQIQDLCKIADYVSGKQGYKKENK